jgi:DNA-binding HxlR family transcriptional regulator
MKTSAGQYAFSKAELQILREIARGNYELSSFQAKLSVKPSLLTYTLKKLQTKGLVKITHKGARKQVYFSETKHTTLLRDLFSIYDYVDWENVLNDKGVEILLQILTGSGKLTRIPRNTLWRYTNNLKSRGIITQEGKINPQFKGLSEFLDEYQSYFTKKAASTISGNSVILWQQDMEFLVRAPKEVKEIPQKFHKTSISMFGEYGLPLFTDFMVYFYSVNKQSIRLEDALLHTLLIEPKNVRYTTYALLLLKKTQGCIDRHYLQQEAQRLGLNDEIIAMLQFLESHKRLPDYALPSWDEFVIKAKDYGVMIE